MKYDWINLIFFGQGGSIPVCYQYGINVYALFTMKFFTDKILKGNKSMIFLLHWYDTNLCTHKKKKWK